MRKFTSFILILSLIFACTAVPVQSGIDSISSAEGMSAYYDDDGIIRLIQSFLALLGIDSDLAKLLGLKNEEENAGE